MRVAYYCQHVLGIGHFHRSLEICKALAENHQVTLILGGPKVEFDSSNMSVLQLPGLHMDADFNNLAPCNPENSLESVKSERARKLYDWFVEEQPDVFMIELYPFGRKAFRFELDPVLKSIREGNLSPCKCYVSLRDILVERPDDQEKFESRIVKTLNKYFDGLFIHSDEKVVSLKETFSRMNDIKTPIFYTGFITRNSTCTNQQTARRTFAGDTEKKLIVVSIGGGNVGGELLEAALGAFSLLPKNHYRMQLFCGPYFPEAAYQKLQSELSEEAFLDRFSSRFPDWLLAADLSISMAGYNTCMNLLTAGIPAIVYPFAQNREQRYRVSRLQAFGSFHLLTEQELQPQSLARIIEQMSARSRYQTTINLDGAAGTRDLLEQLHPSRLA